MSSMKNTNYQISDEEYYRFSSLLKDIQTFTTKHENVTYIEFDYYVVRDMTLFSVDPDFDFGRLKNTIHQIRKSTPSIKRIFSKPIIVLKDTDDVLPVENARIINQNTLLHLANHSHNVSNLTKRGVKPRKLLTRIYEDDYSIYENVIFCNYIDEVLSLIKKNRRILNSLLYASNIMKFNLLEKVNHVDYFLALGKLHTGYIRDFSQYFSLSKELLTELSQIKQVINPRLSKAVYQKNKARNKSLSLKKTNIFLMQKDYHQVYKTYKYLLTNQIIVKKNQEEIDYELLIQNYLTYVRILTIFAVGHFNFEIDPKVKMNLNFLNTVFSFKEWKLIISNTVNNELILHFTKELDYKIMIVASKKEDIDIEQHKIDYSVDEIIVANQFDEDYLERDDVYISMEDVDSFRRIQQLVLKGMVYADTARTICPFCGGKLKKEPYKNVYQCNDCMTQIKEMECLETNKPFYYTDNAHLKKYAINISDYKQDEYWFYKKQIESSMFFRNITKINHQGEIICPHCNKFHEH